MKIQHLKIGAPIIENSKFARNKIVLVKSLSSATNMDLQLINGMLESGFEPIPITDERLLQVGFSTKKEDVDHIHGIDSNMTVFASGYALTLLKEVKEQSKPLWAKKTLKTTRYSVCIPNSGSGYLQEISWFVSMDQVFNWFGNIDELDFSKITLQ